MTIKSFIDEVDKRLDAKCSWGKNEVKSLLRDVAINLYEGNNNGHSDSTIPSKENSDKVSHPYPFSRT